MPEPSPSFSNRHSPRPIGIVLVDDHPAVLRGLADMLDGEPGLQVLGTAENEAQALDLVQRLKPEAAVVDFHLAGENGLELALKLDLLADGPRVVVYSAFPGASLVAASAIAGACGVVAKHGLARELPDAIRATRTGRRTMPRLTRMELSALASRLDERDRPLLSMFARGVSSTEAARATHIDEAELPERRRKMLHALTDRSHAALSAMRGSALHYSPSHDAG